MTLWQATGLYTTCLPLLSSKLAILNPSVGFGVDYYTRDLILIQILGMAEIILNFFRSTSDKRLNSSLKKVALKYLCTYFILDLLPLLRLNIFNRNFELIVQLALMMRIRQIFRLGKTMGRGIQNVSQKTLILFRLPTDC